MTADYGSCDVCKGKVYLKDRKEVGGTKYLVLECENCRKQLIRHVD